MSCGCELVPICVGGMTFYASIQYDARGNFLAGRYIDNALTTVTLTANNFVFGECSAAARPDVFRVVAPLAAGNNVITHNLGALAVGAGFSTEIEVRNQATGAIVAASAVAETANTVTLFVPVAVAAARISIDV